MRTTAQWMELVKQVAQRMTKIEKGDFEEGCPIGIIDFQNWEWPQGVGLYGLYQVYRQTNDGEIFQIIKDWYEYNLKKGLPPKNVNTTAPMLTLAYLYEETGDKRYLALCEEWAEWVMHDLPRVGDGGFQHIVSGADNEGQLWDDTLFMTVLFLAKMGMIKKEQAYIEESIRQFLVHIKYLFDRKTGLWFHGWNFNGRHHFADALWGRGNCWFTAGVVDYLEMTNLQGGVRWYLIDTLKNQVDALVGFQAQDGMWHTLINEAASYEEASATAGFAYGILKAVRLQLLDSSYLQCALKAAQAVIDRIGQNGAVADVSYGTGIGFTLDDYRTIPLCEMAYGQALTVMMLNEVMQVQES